MTHQHLTIRFALYAPKYCTYMHSCAVPFYLFARMLYMSMYCYGTGCKTDGGEITRAKQRKRISCRWRRSCCINRPAEVWANKNALCVVCCIDILFCTLSQKYLYRAIYYFSSPKVKITAAGDSDVRHFKLCFVHHQSRRVFMKNVLVKVCTLWYLQN